MQYFLKAYKNYFKFSGRASVKELLGFFVLFFLLVFSVMPWVFVLTNDIVSFSLKYSLSLPKSISELSSLNFSYAFSFNFNNITANIIYLAIIFIGFLPILSLLVRRLHDIGRSGWYILLLLFPAISISGIPLVGTITSTIRTILSIIFIIMLLIPGKDIENKYGQPSVAKKLTLLNLFILVVLPLVVVFGFKEAGAKVRKMRESGVQASALQQVSSPLISDQMAVALLKMQYSRYLSAAVDELSACSVDEDCRQVQVEYDMNCLAICGGDYSINEKGMPAYQEFGSRLAKELEEKLSESQRNDKMSCRANDSKGYCKEPPVFKCEDGKCVTVKKGVIAWTK